MSNATDCRKEEQEDVHPVVQSIAQIIYDKSGKNIFAIDIRGVSSLCDFCIIAEGTVDRHVRAIGQTIQEDMALMGQRVVKVEGMQEGHWVILDYLNVMVHILTPAFREKYCLERLWEQGTIIDLNFKK